MPPSGVSPIAVYAGRSRAPAPSTMRSPESASDSPMPAAQPLTATTTGAARSSRAR